MSLVTDYFPCEISALADFHDSVPCHIGKMLHQTTGPANFNVIGFSGRPEAKVQTQIALRVVSTTAPHFLRLLVFASSYGHTRADRVAIRLRALQVQ